MPNVTRMEISMYCLTRLLTIVSKIMHCPCLTRRLLWMPAIHCAVQLSDGSFFVGGRMDQPPGRNYLIWKNHTPSIQRNMPHPNRLVMRLPSIVGECPMYSRSARESFHWSRNGGPNTSNAGTSLALKCQRVWRMPMLLMRRMGILIGLTQSPKRWRMWKWYSTYWLTGRSPPLSINKWTVI